MHFEASYVTGPCAVFLRAPTGQTDAQEGSWQFMQSRRMNLSPRVRTAVSLCADWYSSEAIPSSYPRLFCVAHACSHCLHPMHWVASYKSALLMKYGPGLSVRTS